MLSCTVTPKVMMTALSYGLDLTTLPTFKLNLHFPSSNF